MNTVTDSSFGKEVEEASDEQVVIVNFSASWCGPCKAMRPQVEAIEAKSTGAKFVYCDIDDAPMQTEKFGVLGVPTYVVMRNRKEHARFAGSGPQVLSGIQESIEKFSV
jgi:thioredoxin 1